MSHAMKNKNYSARLLCAAACALLWAGCAGDPAVTGAGAPLLTASVAALPALPEDAIGMAPPDCAGRLGNVGASHLRFEVASLTAGLVAVVDGSGSVICVDSVSDVQSDLTSSGQTTEADAVVAGFLAAVHEADGQGASISSGRALPDPEPQPNSRPRPGTMPDPEPQPN
jgi:hypothetical protein